MAIDIRDLSLTFETADGPVYALEKANLAVRPGEFISFIGPSGCGKTTSLKMINRLIEPSSGTITIGGQDITHSNPTELRRQIGYVIQGGGLLPHMTVKQNIAFGLTLRANHVAAGERDAICDHYLELMGLSDFANSFPKHLSGGMRQRLAIARAYAVKPQFLLMDEPFGALDEMTRERLQHEVHAVRRATGCTVLFVTHSVPEAVFLSDRVVVMSARPGRIAAVVDVALPSRDDAVRATPAFAEAVVRVRGALRGTG